MTENSSEKNYDRFEARLTIRQGRSIRKLAEKIHGSNAAALRTVIDVGLSAIDPEY